MTVARNHFEDTPSVAAFVGKFPMSEFVSSLRFRLLALVLAAVIPAFGVILYGAARHRNLIADQVQRNALAAARAIAVEQGRLFENAHQLLIVLARLPQIRENNKSACSKILAGMLEPLYADLGVVDNKGKLLCSALPPKSSMIKPNGPLQNRIIQSYDFAMGNIRANPATGKTVLDLGYPLLKPPGTLRAIIFAVLDLSWAVRLTALDHLDPGATFTLVDANGNVFLRYPKGESKIGKAIFARALSDSAMSQDTEKTVDSLGADGVLRLFAFSPLTSPVTGRNLYAAIDIPAALAFADADRILTHNLIILGLLSALTLIAAWFGANIFVLRRIRDLIDAMKQVAAGKLSARTRLPYGTGELGQMARAFDDLAEALEKREEEARASAKQIYKHRQQQNVLYELNLAITSTLDLASVLSTLLEHISGLFPSCTAMVSWIDQRTGTLEPIAQRNLANGDASQTDTVPDQGLPLIVLQRRSPLAVSNAQIHPQTTNPEFFRRHRLRSYLGLPLIAKDEALGVLSCYMKEEREFSPEEVNFLTALVNQAAIAIYNSRLYEQTRNQAVELEKSNRIKDEFLGVMSHELRTPINIVMNYAEALKMGMFGDIGPDQDKGIEKIRSQAEHLLTLINGILEITKIDSQTATLQSERIDLVEFFSETQSDYIIPADKNLALEWKYPPELPAIISDRMKLKQILANLVNNACKFTEQGSVTVSVQLVDQGHTLECKVSDTGRGIPQELLPVIFDKFRQIDSTTTRNFSGAGLGLYIAKNFVQLLKGTIEVESRAGEGSTFTVRLPIEVDNTVIPSASRSPEAPRNFLKG
jgi:signal transduction histidine kinase/HAMP domain-containing protein